ncbi:MAG: nuclear transport factor 2 family protein [Bacteroidota bacterium]
MRFSLILLLFTFLLFSCATNQKSSIGQNDLQEEALVRQTIELYFDGWRNCQSEKIGQAMHTTCQLKNIKADGIDGVAVYDRETYLGFIKPAPPRAAKTRILYIDITREIASAKCQIELADRLYTDYFNMMKIDGRWYIVDKAAINWEKE